MYKKGGRDVPVRGKLWRPLQSTDQYTMGMRHDVQNGGSMGTRGTCRVIGSFKRHTLQNGSTLIPDDTKEQNGKQLLEWLNIQQRTTAHEEIPSWESQLIPNVD
jgi:hypothetical protein